MGLMKKDMAGRRHGARARRHGHGCGPAACGFACCCRSSRTPSRRRPSGPAISTAAARGSRSRSATPTPKAASCWPMPWHWPVRRPPGLLIDFATLTGAARVALGPDLPALYTDDDEVAAAVAQPRARRLRPRLADAAVATLRQPARWQGLGPQQHLGRSLRGFDHGGALPRSFRHAGGDAPAFRPLRLEPDHEAGAAGGRRGADRAPPVRVC